MKRSIILIVCFFFLSISSFPQTGCEFWFAAPDITSSFVSPSPYFGQDLDRPIKLFFSTFEGPTVVTISQPANGSFTPIQVTVMPDSVKEVDLTPYIDQIETKPPNTVLNTGLKIVSNKLIRADYEVRSLINSETFTLKGENALGRTFLIPSQDIFPNYQYCDPKPKNSFSILAIENLTTVQVVPSNAIVGHAAKDTVEIILNRGQTWCAEAMLADSLHHLGGSWVFSNKPVCVTVCDDAVFPSSYNYTKNPVDLAGDQLIPQELAGTDFFSPTALVAVPGGAWAFIYAYEDSTDVYMAGSYRGKVDKGHSMSLVNLYNNGAYTSYIHTSKPVSVYQFTVNGQTAIYGNTYCGQAAAAVVPPVFCSGSRRVTVGTSGFISSTTFNSITLVTQSANIGNITFYYPPPTWPFTPTSSFFHPVAGTNQEWWTISVGYPMYEGGTTVIDCTTGTFHATATIFVDTLFGRLSYFSDFTSLNLGSDKEICAGDSIILNAGYGKDSYLWNTGETTETITVHDPGTYWVLIQDGTCTMSDTVHVIKHISVPVNLGPDKFICSGDSTLLDAGPGKIRYTWNTGQTTQTIWAKTPGNYWVEAYDSYCPVYDTIKVTATTSPSLTTNPLAKPICSGESTNILLTSNVPTASFFWTASLTSGNITGFSADSGQVIDQVLTNNAATSGEVTYHIVPVLGNCTGDTSHYTVTVNQGDSVDVSVTASTNNICAGTPVTFTATPVNGGASPQYQWQVNGINNGTNNPGFTYTPANGDLVTCILTSSETVCISNNPATSNAITMTVNPNLPVSVSVSATADTVCEGTPVTFTAMPVNGGVSPVYQWQVNGINIVLNSPNFTYTPSNGDIVICILTSSEICTSNNPANSIPFTVTVKPYLPVSLIVTPSENPFCPGSSVTFTTTSTNGGASPQYQWQVNGSNVGMNNPAFSYIPANGDLVTCILTSSELCTTNNPAAGNVIVLQENTSLPAGVAITANPNPFCPGASVTLTATPVNGGTAPVYQWKVNGNNAGTNASSFTCTPSNNDSISCLLTSNLACVSNNPVYSNRIVMNAAAVPVVSFTPCFDTITTTNARPIKLKGGIPLGGTYFGSGVTGNVYYPSVAGTGTHTIIYSYTNTALCSATATLTIHQVTASTVPCGQPFTDIRDGAVYQTISLGSQCWMAEDLHYGNSISTSLHQSDNCRPEKYTHPESVYQWDELMAYDPTPASQGLCPPCWHVPTEADWNALFANWTNNGFAGSPLKYSGFSGFEAILSGARHHTVQWDYAGFAVFFWSSTAHGPYKAWAHGLNEADPSVSAYPASRSNAFSVRCVRD